RRGVVQPRRRPRRLCRHRGPVVAVEAILPATPERSIPLRGLALAALLHAGVAGAAVLLDYPAEPEVPVFEIAYVLPEPAPVPQAPEPAERTAAAPPPPAAAEPEPPPEPLPPAQSEPEPEPVPDAPAAIAAPPPRPAAKPHRPEPAAAPAPAPPQPSIEPMLAALPAPPAPAPEPAPGPPAPHGAPAPAPRRKTASPGTRRRSRAGPAAAVHRADARRPAGTARPCDCNPSGCCARHHPGAAARRAGDP